MKKIATDNLVLVLNKVTGVTSIISPVGWGELNVNILIYFIVPFIAYGFLFLYISSVIIELRIWQILTGKLGLRNEG